MLIGRDDISNDVYTLCACSEQRVFQCLFTLFCAHFPFAPIGGNLTAQSTGELKAEFKFQRRSCKFSSLFPPHRQSVAESLLAGY